MAREALALVLGPPGDPRSNSVTLDIRSEIPPSRGLKSSSAVAVATLRAAHTALGRPSIDTSEIARQAAEISLRSRVSVTGAFDDAAACAGGGLVVADVHRRWLLFASEPPCGLVPVLWIPSASHLPVEELREKLKDAPPGAQDAVAEALRGHWAEAMRLNTRVIERALGYDLEPVKRRGLEAGARVCGVSGNGPALAFLCPPERVPEVVRSLESSEAQVVAVSFVPRSRGEAP